VGNETVANDLLSDVFFDVWQQAGRFEGSAAERFTVPFDLRIIILPPQREPDLASCRANSSWPSSSSFR